MKKFVALYARCSSDKQENLDRSIPAQLSALRDYAEKHDIKIEGLEKPKTDIHDHDHGDEEEE